MQLIQLIPFEGGLFRATESIKSARLKGPGCARRIEVPDDDDRVGLNDYISHGT